MLHKGMYLQLGSHHRVIKYIYIYLPKSISNIAALAPSTITVLPSLIALFTNTTVSQTNGSSSSTYS